MPDPEEDLRADVPEEYLAMGSLICPQCGLIYSRGVAERHGEGQRAA